jgi:hypothetical protein
LAEQGAAYAGVERPARKRDEESSESPDSDEPEGAS